MRQLATPAGIDHDYNFLSAIERSVERSDRLLVEEKGIVTQKELMEGPPEPRQQFNGRGRGRGRGGRGGNQTDGIDHAQVRGENDIKILKECQRIGVRVERLPKGMARQKTNGTSWSRKQKCIVWQVEWLRQQDNAQEGVLETIHSKILTTTPIGIAYKNLLEERRRAAMTLEEKAQEKKKRAAEVAEKAAKRIKTSPPPATDALETSTSEPTVDLTTSPTVAETTAQPTEEAPPPQNTSTSTPSDPIVAGLPPVQKPKPTDPHAEGAESFISDYNFYIRRPHTPSNLPTVLIPLDSSKPLDVLLEGKVIVEFPTIYVFLKTMGRLPGMYMLQDEFFKRMGTGGHRREVEEGEASSEEESSDDEPEAISSKPVIPDSDTSSSGSSDESSEEESSDGDEDEERVVEIHPRQEDEVAEVKDTDLKFPGLEMKQEESAQDKEEDTMMSL